MMQADKKYGEYGISFKMGILIFTIILLLGLSLSGCRNQQTFSASQLLPGRVTDIVAYHYQAGSVTHQELTDEQVAEWTSWLGGLEVWEKTFEAGKSPGDKTEIEFYEFVLNNDEDAIDYVKDGRSYYILFDDRWYAVSNPSNPADIWS